MALIDNLVSYYELDESSGTRSDSHGSNDLTDNNTVGTASGIINDGANFVASNTEYFNASNSAFDFTGTEMSISFWYKATSFRASPGSDRLFQNWSTSGTFQGWFLNISNAGAKKARFVMATGTSSFEEITATTAYVEDTWYHVVFVYNGTDLRIYRNGTLDCTPVAVTANLRASATTPFRIAANESLAANQYCNGVLDEAGIWDRALTAAEVTELYNGGAGLAYPFSGAPAFTPRIIMY
jgi:hypothetical protein